MISVQTLTALAKLREAGIRLVLITGARMSTLLQRLPFLPAADAFVCENGEMHASCADTLCNRGYLMPLQD